jgi:hypothetical protein
MSRHDMIFGQVAMEPLENAQNETDAAAGKLRAADWLWRPWYAKLWWAAIPVYWLGALASLRVEMLERFYETALAGYLNVLFYPPVALMMLGVGYAREWMGPIDWSAGPPSSMSRNRILGPHTNPADPRSGAFYRQNQERLGRYH